MLSTLLSLIKRECLDTLSIWHYDSEWAKVKQTAARVVTRTGSLPGSIESSIRFGTGVAPDTVESSDFRGNAVILVRAKVID
jgi:hypothetical protein